ncbi:hypothetical protein Srubr_26840 [Streptomyces rubradiris]|uniref:Uncharacterized protein n=1 Tax=Streptomyces rubradiris TaxID=285531 RepID=A0ABQ3RAF8_STRRR|nr:hypothetical protein GCM10018792_79200 [Streptomyces rubradiris]GHI52838.1 hypothetical protein Srubr_26840 [Streptomyces rubradiris]
MPARGVAGVWVAGVEEGVLVVVGVGERGRWAVYVAGGRPASRGTVVLNRAGRVGVALPVVGCGWRGSGENVLVRGLPCLPSWLK